MSRSAGGGGRIERRQGELDGFSTAFERARAGRHPAVCFRQVFGAGRESRRVLPGSDMATMHGAFLSQRVDGRTDEQSERSGGDVEGDSRAGSPRRRVPEGRTGRGETQGDETSRRRRTADSRNRRDVVHYTFPREHWHCLRTNNPLERILQEVRRRTRAVGTFPDGKSALMLAAARLRHVAGTKWGTRRYMDMNRLAEASEAAQ